MLRGKVDEGNVMSLAQAWQIPSRHFRREELSSPALTILHQLPRQLVVLRCGEKRKEPGQVSASTHLGVFLTENWNLASSCFISWIIRTISWVTEKLWPKGWLYQEMNPGLGESRQWRQEPSGRGGVSNWYWGRPDSDQSSVAIAQEQTDQWD